MTLTGVVMISNAFIAFWLSRYAGFSYCLSAWRGILFLGVVSVSGVIMAMVTGLMLVGGVHAREYATANAGDFMLLSTIMWWLVAVVRSVADVEKRG